jgi:hypothetical protein
VIHGGLSALSSYHCKGSGDIGTAYRDSVFQPGALARRA